VFDQPRQIRMIYLGSFTALGPQPLVVVTLFPLVVEVVEDVGAVEEVGEVGDWGTAVTVVGGDGVVEGGVVEGAGGTVDGVELADVVVVVGATPVSGDTQPAGGVVGPLCPGISTVPAQPKSEKVVWLVLVDPSEKFAVERV
jgi:hypothetical protein